MTSESTTERGGVHVSYFYDIALPSQYAAAIQILNTCRALSDLGVPTTVYVREMTAPQHECLACYGLSPHDRLTIVPLFGGRWSRVWLQRTLRRVLADGTGESRQCVITRGRAGIDLFDRLARIPAPRTQRRIYEAHRVHFSTLVESATGETGGGAGVREGVRLRARERAAVRSADAVICLTRGVRDALAGEFGLVQPVLVLPSGTVAPLDPPPGDDVRDIDVLYAGKLERRKGVHDLIAAMRFLAGRRLWVLGGTPAEIDDVRRVAEDQGVSDRIVLHGFVEPAQMGRFYRRARVGVCPLPGGISEVSERFTSPLKILDMMAHGVPVVATDLAAVREILEHDRTALLADPGRPESLARAIGALLDDRARAGRLARDARSRVEEYSWANRARRLLDFLVSIP